MIGNAVNNKLRDINVKVTADLMQICGPHFVKVKWSTPTSFSSKRSDRIWSERGKIGPTITALLQLDSAFEDCLIARRLLSKTRLKSNKTKLTSMLRFVWQGFHHSTYIYYEKIGLLNKQFAELPYQGLGQINLVEMKKSSKKQLLELIQSRGETVHSWHRDHKSIYTLGMVEILSEHEKLSDIAKEKNYDLDGHTQDAIYDLKFELKKWEQVLFQVHCEKYTSATNLLIKHVEKFNQNMME